MPCENEMGGAWNTIELSFENRINENTKKRGEVERAFVNQDNSTHRVGRQIRQLNRSKIPKLYYKKKEGTRAPFFI